MSIDRSRRTSFEDVADLYNEVRPGYPEELVSDILSLSAMPADGRILEVGCGPGNATVSFARRGYRLLAIELGAKLAAHAARRCAAYRSVTIRQTSFEEWDVESGAFDLAISADAFHWIPPEIGYSRVAQALKPSGSAAFFWNVPVDPRTGWSAAIDDLYLDLIPGIDNPDKSFDFAWLSGIITGNFSASGCFGEVTCRQYALSETLTSDQYVKQVRTQSSLRDLDDKIREKLFVEIRSVIDRFGGVVEKPRLVALFHAISTSS